MKDMNAIKEMLCKELEEYARKGRMSGGDLDVIHKLTDTIKNIDKIEMLEDVDGGYSSRRDARGRYSRDGYDDGESYANRGKHYVRGHYSRDDGYSREGARERMVDQLERMMDDASNDREREAIRRCLNQLQDA